MLFKTRLYFALFLLLAFTFSGSVYGAIITNAGFGSESILISSSTPVNGETIHLSIPLYNQSGGTLSGVVRFYQDDKKINEHNITVKNNEFGGVNFDLKVTSGNHNLVIKLEDTTITKPKTAKEIVVLKNRELNTIIHVQDKDGISPVSDGILKEYPVQNETQVIDTSSGIDSYRQDFLNSAEIKMGTIKQDIKENVKQNEQYEARLNELRKSLPRSDGSLLTPLQYLYAWGLAAISYILANVYLFYGLVFLVVFLIIRFIFKKFHNRLGRDS
jgi:hypothetical protein